MEEKLNASTSDMNEPSKAQENDDPNMQQGDDLLRAARLKKKEVQSKNSKRKNNWLDKLHKGKRKATKPPASTKKGAKVYSNLDITKNCFHLLIHQLVELSLAAKKEKG